MPEFIYIHEMNTLLRQPVVLILFLCSITGAAAQVPVHQEPRHRPVYQDQHIRILDVVIPPGDTSLYHIHTTPSLFIRFSTTNTGSQLEGGPASYGRSEAGKLLFENLAPPYTRTHRVWNTDKDTFHVMDVELLYEKKSFVQDPLNAPGLQLETDTAWVRAYRLRLEKGMTFQLSKRKQPLLLVALTASTIETRQKGKRAIRTLKAGGFLSLQPKQAFSMVNREENSATFVVLEFPVN